ncbi:MAG TPA: hypothetical protein VLG12_01180 [Candidatus Saccharimonadales bacterium]|nr:hypothetical protein [Candidatus Saccharimonadales bacterium]
MSIEQQLPGKTLNPGNPYKFIGLEQHEQPSDSLFVIQVRCDTSETAHPLQAIGTTAIDQRGTVYYGDPYKKILPTGSTINLIPATTQIHELLINDQNHLLEQHLLQEDVTVVASLGGPDIGPQLIEQVTQQTKESHTTAQYGGIYPHKDLIDYTVLQMAEDLQHNPEYIINGINQRFFIYTICRGTELQLLKLTGKPPQTLDHLLDDGIKVEDHRRLLSDGTSDINGIRHHVKPVEGTEELLEEIQFPPEVFTDPKGGVVSNHHEGYLLSTLDTQKLAQQGWYPIAVAPDGVVEILIKLGQDHWTNKTLVLGIAMQNHPEKSDTPTDKKLREWMYQQMILHAAWVQSYSEYINETVSNDLLSAD